MSSPSVVVNLLFCDFGICFSNYGVSHRKSMLVADEK